MKIPWSIFSGVCWILLQVLDVWIYKLLISVFPWMVAKKVPVENLNQNRNPLNRSSMGEYHLLPPQEPNHQPKPLREKKKHIQQMNYFLKWALGLPNEYTQVVLRDLCFPIHKLICSWILDIE